MNDYSENIVKKYKYWTIFVHINQWYLWRCVIRCNRENVIDLEDIENEEFKEFIKIIKILKKWIKNIFNPDWFNYSFLWNQDKHLHCHFVPRYKEHKNFFWQVFEDKRWWSNWLVDENFYTSKEILQNIKIEIQNNIK